MEPTTMAIYWDGLCDLPMNTVGQAIRMHVKDPQVGQYFPKVADVLRHVPGPQSAHLTADAAWPVALQLADENTAVVYTQEIFDAWVEAKPVCDIGDEVGARMAFKAAYTRILQSASATPEWKLTEGHDKALTLIAVEKAQAQGRLLAPTTYERLQIAAPVTPNIAGQLEYANHAVETGESTATPEMIMDLTQAIKKFLNDPRPNEKAEKRKAEQARFEERRHEQLARLAEYERQKANKPNDSGALDEAA